MKASRAVLAVFFVFVVTVGMTAAAVSDELNTAEWDDEDTAPHPITATDVTKASHDMSEGASDAALMGYEDDSGDWIAGADNAFALNDTSDVDDGENVNPYSFNAGHIEDSSYTAFAEDGTWQNASDWTAGGTDSGSLTISNASVVSGVDGVRFQGSSITSGAHANFSSWDTQLDTDEGKRVLQVGMDVDALPADTNVTLRVYDEDHDYKEVVVDEGGTVDGNVFATSTGDSNVFQIKLSKLATNGGGDFDNIETVYLNMTGDADVTVSWLDLRKKSRTKLGEKFATTNDDGNDPDEDGDFDEIQTIYNATGAISVHSMDSLDPEFDDAVIHDVTYPVHYEGGALSEEGEEGDYVVYWENASNPGYDHTLNASFRLTLPSAIDLSYSNAEVKMTQKWPEARYLSLGVATGVADSTNLTDADTTSKLASLGAKGDEIQLEASPSGGENIVVHYEMQFTDAERSDDVGAAAVPADEGEGGGAAPAESEGGFWSDPVNWVWSGIVAVLGFFGARRFGIIGGGS